MSIRSLFSEADLESIRAAVAATEQNSAGEIVPYLVDRVDGYKVAHWRLASVCALVAALLAGAIQAQAAMGSGLGIVLSMVLPALGIGVAHALASVSAIQRGLLSDRDVASLVHWRAEAAFLEEEVFGTRDRTGILIFLAVFERRAVILADAGINCRVPADLWQDLVDELVDGIRTGRAADALCSTIDRCGKILQHYGVEVRPDDRNELSDGPRIRER